VSGLRDTSFADFHQGAILFEDEDIVVVDKPAFVPSQEAREGAADDVVARLRSFLARRDGRPTEDVYLGTHQRLDRETSGVMVLAKRAEANAWLARAFEGREVEKVYVAAVEGAKVPDRARLVDHLAADRGGVVRVVSASHAGAQRAETAIRVLARRRNRTLVEATIATGRTHQIRAQLAHRGAPVAGDGWYGGAPWPRLALHSSRLELPRASGRTVVEAKVPASITRFMEGVDLDPATQPSALDEVLARAADRRFALAWSPDTTAFRWLHEAGDGAPGLALDVYGEHLLLHVYRDDAKLEPILDRLAETGAAGVYVKHRPVRANTLDDAAIRALAPPEPVRGRAAKSELVVTEHGVPFLVRLGDGLSTGLFLDQRENRARVRAMAGGKRVLNLFSYTCAFSVVAAAGGASAIMSVDASVRALERGRAAFTAAGLDASLHETAADDVFDVLERLRRRGRRFDLVIVDPPTYSSTKKTRFTSGSMWRELSQRAVSVLDAHGSMLATSNDRRLTQGAFREAIREGARTVGVELAQLRDLPPPVDFPALPGSEPHLKGVLARLG
jgi:23S rRNA (cytosine1962-C5)-methyltransferase